MIDLNPLHMFIWKADEPAAWPMLFVNSYRIVILASVVEKLKRHG